MSENRIRPVPREYLPVDKDQADLRAIAAVYMKLGAFFGGFYLIGLGRDKARAVQRVAKEIAVEKTKQN